jgi:putative peptidoglycan lipid II flippase
VAGSLVATGWLIAAVLPLLVLGPGAGPYKTLQALGLASSLGMTVAAVGLFVAVRRAWGPEAFRGFGRSALTALGAGALSAIVGRALAGVLHPTALVAGAAVAVVVAVVVVTLFAASVWVGDRDSARLAVARLPVRRRWSPR